MGCDIHLYKEKFVDGKWLSADIWQPCDYNEEVMEVPYETTFNGRNYNLFGLLCKGVRDEYDYSFLERGFPFDASKEVTLANEKWDSDGHSHSYLFLHEIKSMKRFLENQSLEIKGMMNKDQLKRLNQSIESGAPDWDLIYPYCQWGSNPDLVEFELKVPAIFKVGNQLDKIIDLFEGVDGENHRIVFWFDN